MYLFLYQQKGKIDIYIMAAISVFYLVVYIVISAVVCNALYLTPQQLEYNQLNAYVEYKHPTVQKRQCSKLNIPMCKKMDLYGEVFYPNLLKHKSQYEAVEAMKPFLPLLADSQCQPYLQRYMCYMYAPMCTIVDEPLPPCKPVCMAAKAQCKTALSKKGLSWPQDWACEHLPASGLCINFEQGHRDPTPVKAPSVEPPIQLTPPPLPKLDLLSPTLNTTVLPRRFDIKDDGDTKMFRGWVDVQGQGAANDYCRVIGSNPKQRFLACTLAGSKGSQDTYVYVSKRGFDAGYRNTWFMKDMDKDGRDDYCRCIGRGQDSKITCMKAGEKGFYGGVLQRGKEHTFVVKTSKPCVNMFINPYLGL